MSEQMPRKFYELPLLKSLIELGGAISPNDDHLYQSIAAKMGFVGKNMTYDVTHSRPRWTYNLQWVRYELVKKGELDGSQRGIWRITEKGRERVRREWEAFRLPEGFKPEQNTSAEATSEAEEIAATQSDKEWAAKFVPASLETIKGQLLIENTPVNQIVTIINTNRHIILTGPPGTGKTSLAINTGEEAVAAHFISGYILTTATADWTTFDTIGGYMPQANTELMFQPGIVLRAVRENKWLLIDEINRADVDKAFGQILTVLSGQEVELPFSDEQNKPLRIRRAGGLQSYYEAETATYFIGDNWRIIGTMNTFDKNSLFALSYAFMRRFGFVHINNPSRHVLAQIIEGRIQDGHLSAGEAANVKNLLDITPRELGPSILIDILNYIQERKTPEALFESIVAYVLPQFEGLGVENIAKFYREARLLIPDKASREQMKRYLAEMFELDFDAWDAS